MLKEVLEQHAIWLKNSNEGKQADLRGADLRKVELRGANLIYADLRGANLSYAKFVGSNLIGTNLSDANLKDANLKGANIDYSCLPLWCGSLGVKVDDKIVYQLLYHVCSLDCDSDEFKEIKDKIKIYANKFHRVEECGEIE